MEVLFLNLNNKNISNTIITSVYFVFVTSFNPSFLWRSIYL